MVAPANTAKKQMTSIFDEPAPPVMRKIRAGKGGGGDNTSMCKIQGVVTRTKDEVANGPSGPIPKKRIDIIVTGVIANGAQDIVRTGVEGEVFLFPTRIIDTPEQAEVQEVVGAAEPRGLLSAPPPANTVANTTTGVASAEAPAHSPAADGSTSDDDDESADEQLAALAEVAEREERRLEREAQGSEWDEADVVVTSPALRVE